MRMKIILKSMCFAPAILAGASAWASDADTILLNGNILTVDDAFSTAQALAIKDSRIIAIGDAESVASHQGEDTVTIDLAGKTVIPGLIDNHLHFIRSAWNFPNEVRFDDIGTRADALKAIADKAKNSAPGEWVVTIGGWTPNQFSDSQKPFTLAELDAAAPENPVYLLQTYSSGYANTKAFEAIEQPAATSASLRGRETLRPFTNAVSWRNKTASESTLLAYMAELNSEGLTTVYDVGRPSEGKLTSLETLAEKGPMPLRVFHTLRFSARSDAQADDVVKMLAEDADQAFSHDEQFGLIGLGEHIYTPMLDNNRHDHPWEDGIWSPFAKVAMAAAKNGWTVHEHVKSDMTADQFMDLFDTIQQQYPDVSEKRWTLAHVDVVSKDSVERAQRLGLAFGVHSQSIMKARAKNQPLIGDIQRSGILWGLGSDGAIVAPTNPFLTLWWTVSGKDIAGEEMWTVDQRISREEALVAHTISNAKLLFAEDDLGSLEVGKLADLVVLDRNYLTVPVDAIRHIEPVMTMTGGRIVYEAQ